MSRYRILRHTGLGHYIVQKKAWFFFWSTVKDYCYDWDGWDISCSAAGDRAFRTLDEAHDFVRMAIKAETLPWVKDKTKTKRRVYEVVWSKSFEGLLP